jgi:hypothetical protein
MPQIFTRTERVVLYTFAELVKLEEGELTVDEDIAPDKRAVDKAREWLREGALDYEWWDTSYDMWKEALEQIGFSEPDISFSGFCSQGDGASFTCKSVDIEPLLDFLCTPRKASQSIGSLEGDKGEDFRPWLLHKTNAGYSGYGPKMLRLLTARDYISCRVERTSHHYVHSNTCTFYAEWEGSGNHPRIEALVQEFERVGEALRDDLSDAIYEFLEEESEWLTSDEALVDSADANDWVFDRHGEFCSADEYDEGKKRTLKKKPVRPAKDSVIDRIRGTRRLLRE